MAEVRRHPGDKVKTNANGVLVITRANGTVVKYNGKTGVITRTKPSGKIVKQVGSRSVKLPTTKVQTRGTTPTPAPTRGLTPTPPMPKKQSMTRGR
jgi:hypothetical protein